jgi:hypothetical protein
MMPSVDFPDEQCMPDDLDKDYKLVPMSEITEEARDIAVRWVENYRPMGFDLPGKHKLASDIMNYARRYHEQELKKLKP